MNRLIDACGDDISVQLAVSTTIADDAERVALLDRAKRREQFRRELRKIVRALGGRTPERPSAIVTVRRLLSRVRGIFGSSVEGELLARSARAESRAARTYEEVLRGPLPLAARAVIVKQHAEIVDDARKLRLRAFSDRPTADAASDTA